MEISEHTLDVLKNFSEINQGIYIRKGKKELFIRSVVGHILARADIEEDFPIDFAIYDIIGFINALSIFNEPVLEFNSKKYVTIKEKNGRPSCKYHFTEPSLIRYPEKKFKMPLCEINFSLSEANLNQIQKASSVLQAPDLSVKKVDKDIVLFVHDKKSSDSDSYSLVVGEYKEKENFLIDFQNENIKLLADGYNVKITSKKASHFIGINNKVEYWIAVETSSTFG